MLHETPLKESLILDDVVEGLQQQPVIHVSRSYNADFFLPSR